MTKARAPESDRAGSATAVLVVTPWFPNRPADSNAAYVYKSAAAMARRGLQVHVAVCRPWLPRGLRHLPPEWMRGDVELGAFQEFRSITCLRYAVVPGAHFRNLSNRSMDFTLSRALARALRRTGARLLHVHTEGLSPPAVQTAHALGLRSIVTLHGINTDPHFLRAGKQRGRISQALNRADRIALVGEPLRAFFKELVGWDDHFRIVPNGFDVSELPARVRPLLRSDAPIRFISVSNLHEGKGIDITLRALACVRGRGLQDWDYTIVGAGSQRSDLTALSENLGLTEKVRFIGAQPPRRVFELLADSDVFVLPSYREAFGIAYLEAMAAGLVAIGVKGQGPSTFIESGRNGFLVEPCGVDDLVRTICDIAERRTDMQAVGYAAAETVRERFSWDAHASSLLTVYREVLSDHDRQGRSGSCR